MNFYLLYLKDFKVIKDMIFKMAVTLFVLSIIGGFLSGLLGIGGAVIMIPLMISVPPLTGAGTLSMKAITGLSMVQILASSVSGVIIHNKNKYVNKEILFYTGIPMGLSALAGSYLSKYFSDKIITIFFIVFISASFIILLLDSIIKKAVIDDADIEFNKVLLITAGVVIGLLSGVAGVGGGFLLIPFMIAVLKVPVRITVGTSLGIIFIAAAAGAAGKILSFQVPWLLIIPVLLGSIPAARLGAMAGKKLPEKAIKLIMMSIIVISIIQVIIKLFR